MKIYAHVELSDTKAKAYGQTCVKMPIDMDCVKDDDESVNKWIANELEKMFGGSFCPGYDFTALFTTD